MRTVLLIFLLVAAGIASWCRGGKSGPDDFKPMNFDEGMAIGFFGGAIGAGSLAIAWECGLGDLLDAIAVAVLQ